MTQIKEKKRFIKGGINLDVDPSLLSPEDTTYRLNVVVDEDNGALVNSRGNELMHALGSGLPFPLPEGDIISEVGVCEWVSDNSFIYFAVTSSGFDIIWKFSRDTNTATLIYFDNDVLNLSTDHPITHINVIGGILYWTDGANPPRKLNIEKAINYIIGSGDKYTEITEQTISAAQYPPMVPPRVSYKTDTTVSKNNLRGKQFQFCYRWIMTDNEITSTSPFSGIAIPSGNELTDLYLASIQKNNCIDIAISGGGELVKAIEIFAREGDNGDWFRITILNKDAYSISDEAGESYIFSFYNDITPIGAVQNDINATNDNFPQLSDTQEIIDEGIMAYGGITEGYENVVIDVDLYPRLADTSFETSTIKTFVRDLVLDEYIPTVPPIQQMYNLRMSPNELLNTIPTSGQVVKLDFESQRGYSYHGEIKLGPLDVIDTDSFFAAIVKSVEQYGSVFYAQVNAAFTDKVLTFLWVNGDNFTVHNLSVYNVNTVDIITSVNTDYVLNEFTKVAHGLSDGLRVQLSNIVSTDGIDTTSTYYVVNASTNSFSISLTYDGPAVDLLTANGSCDVIVLDSSGIDKSFKIGAVHPIGIVYFDNAGRHGGVNVSSETNVKMPFYNESVESGVADNILSEYNVVHDSTQSWDASLNGELSDKYVIFTSGKNAGEMRRIGISGPSYFYFAPNVVYAVSPGDKYIVINGNIRSRGEIIWNINHVPPIWATRWMWVYAGNNSMSKWIQYIIAQTDTTLYKQESILNGEVPYLTGAAVSGSATTLINSGFGAVNSQAGSYVTIISSSNTALVNTTRKIKENTSTEITVYDAFPGDISAGDVYAIHYGSVYSNGYTEYTLVNIGALNQHSSGSNGFIYPSSSIMPYTYTAGDRMRFITQSSIYTGTANKPLGLPVNGYIDVEIFGYKDNDPTSNILVIPKINFTELLIGDGSLIEIYSPMSGLQEKVYYATDQIYEIGDAGTATRYHKGQTRDQVIDLLVPSLSVSANGYLTAGDSYIYPRAFSEIIVGFGGASGRIDVVESQNMSDIYLSSSYGKGKAFIELQNAQTKKYKFIRYSDKYFADTEINGLSRFPAANRTKQFDESFGDIFKIQQVGFTLRVLQARKPSTIYIGRSILTSDSGDEQVTQSSSVLSLIRPQVYDTGTVLPNSVCSVGSNTYFFDIYNGKFQRMSNNGVETLSDMGMRQWFLDKADALLASGIENIDVIVAFDKKHDSILITFIDLASPINDETLIFYEPTNRWVTWASFIPTRYANCGNKLYSFKNGMLYEHDSDNVPRCNFYGVQYNCEVMILSNIHPDIIRVLDSIEIETNENKSSWSVPAVTTDISDEYPNGQWSMIPASKFVSKQGRLYAYFLRDKYSKSYPGDNYAMINGRKLRGNVFYVLLKNDSTTKVVLSSASLNSTRAMLS